MLHFFAYLSVFILGDIFCADYEVTIKLNELIENSGCLYTNFVKADMIVVALGRTRTKLKSRTKSELTE